MQQVMEHRQRVLSDVNEIKEIVDKTATLLEDIYDRIKPNKEPVSWKSLREDIATSSCYISLSNNKEVFLRHILEDSPCIGNGLIVNSLLTMGKMMNTLSHDLSIFSSKILKGVYMAHSKALSTISDNIKLVKELQSSISRIITDVSGEGFQISYPEPLLLC